MKDQVVALFHRVYGRAPEFVTWAPGRIEFIGNHTDYNGGTVLGASIDRGIWVGIARRTDGMRHYYSQYSGEVVKLGADIAAKQQGAASWVNYPMGILGAFPVFGLRAPEGFDLVTVSNLPAGAGLSSSAALELSSALAFLHLTGQAAEMETLVKIGRHAENHFVGVPCGILDQGVSGFGKKNHLVYIDCRGPKFATVPMPTGAHFWVFNTHTKHALVDGLYAARHRECMEAAKVLGVSLLVEASAEAVQSGASRLSLEASKRARHVVDEIARVGETNKALRAGDLTAVGGLLTASHRSSQNNFENSTEELDFLVDALVATAHVYGARLTGGGFGGAVMALTGDAFGDEQAQSVARLYTLKYGTAPEIIHCQTGDGAALI